MTVFTRLALENDSRDFVLRIPGVPRTIARHLQMQYDERRTRWYQSILFFQDSLLVGCITPAVGPCEPASICLALSFREPIPYLRP